MAKRKFKTGSMLRHIITGFTGVAIAATEWMTGCYTYGLKSQTLHDGKPINAQWFDENELELAKPKKVMKVSTKDPGGPHATPQRGRS